jgi:hypothetical protein
MSSTEIPLSRFTRVLAAVVGIVVLCGGVAYGWTLLQAGSYVYAAASAFGGVAAGRMFLQAARRGTSPDWRARRLPPGTSN